MHDQILKFWFEEIDEALWWKKDDDFDRLIGERFGALHAQAKRCELFAWRQTPEGRLAEVIVLDQFSRNMFRGLPGSFASDPLALALAQEAVAVGADSALPDRQRNFLYMPFMHSESLVIHEVAVALFQKSGNEKMLSFELKHKALIDRFGRYPHRNAILGRASTAEETEYLQQPGAGF